LPPIVKVSTDYGIYPILELSNGYRIMYDEELFHTFESGSTVHGIRSVEDETPQYIIETDMHYPGGRWDPPSSDPITLAVCRSLPDLVVSLMRGMEERNNVEVCYDPREELVDWRVEQIDYASIPYRRETFTILAECLKRVFNFYRSNFEIKVRDFELEFTAEDLRATVSEATGGNWPRSLVLTLRRPAAVDDRYESFHPGSIVNEIWRAWLKTRLAEFLRTLTP
jgi:hypothetical protein